MAQAALAAIAPYLNSKFTVLVIDDEACGLEAACCLLQEAGYGVLSATNGQEGCDMLERYPQIQAIAVDRIMPGLDGMSFVRKVKADQRFRHIPIIMQTAATTSDHVREGVEAGVYYYLTKPFNDSLFLSVVDAALQEHTVRTSIDDTLKQHNHLLASMASAVFSFRTVEEAKAIAFALGSSLSTTQAIAYGLYEILLNAVEHGNLGFSYQDKKRLLMQGHWHEALATRLARADQQERFATLEFSSNDEGHVMTVSDCGVGFDWRPFFTLSPARVSDPNGRGIYMAYTSAFDHMRYNETGNVVSCFVRRH